MIGKLSVILVTVAFLAVFCPSCTAAPSQQPGQSGSAQPAAATSPAQAATAGQLADEGKTVYAGTCAKCHGTSGEGKIGPAIIGASASLSKYGTGQGLYDFVSTVMPADAAGTLSKADYLRVVAYLLVQNNLVPAQSNLDANTLNGIHLK